MRDIKDVLLYIARRTPAGHKTLGEMERIIHEHFGAEPAAAAADPGEHPEG